MRRMSLALLGGVAVLGWLASVLAQQSSPLPQWIWFKEGDPLSNAPAETRYFRKTFTVEQPVSAAKLEITADNAFTVWLNGQRVGSAAEWQALHAFDVKAQMVQGMNVLAVEAENQGGPAGMVVRLTYKSKGQSRAIVTDGSWKASAASGKDWQQPQYKETAWTPALVLGPYGKTGPWGGGAAVARNPKERFTVPAGFAVEPVVPPDATYEGMTGRHVSFVNMCFDAQGRLLLSQEGGPILLADQADDKGLFSKLAVYCPQVRNCQGMCWAHDALFLVGDGPQGTGLYRCRDANKDDKIDEVKLLHRFQGGMGEHGPHAVIHGPDDMLYLVVGNHAWMQIGPDAAKNGANPDKIAAHSPLLRWPTGRMGPDQNRPNTTEDVLLPRLNDANGHAANILAPGGTIWRLDRDGQRVGLVNAGFRNQYDAAFGPTGELFTFDSDMEWDVGLPWYRDVRIVHCPPGGDFGWRTGAANQMAYLFDTLPPLVDTGRGSPVGVEFYDHVAFPEKYRTLYVADWAIGTVYAVHMQPSGGSYKGEAEKFITGTPMNVTDLAVGPDGALYFSLGGRGTQGEVYRIRWKEYQPTKANDDPLCHLLTAPQPLAAWRRAEFRQILAKNENLIPQLQEAAQDKNRSPAQRIRALDLLQNYTDAGPATPLLLRLAADAQAPVRAQAIWLLGVRAPAESKAALTRALADTDALVRRRACEAMIRAGIEPPVEALWPLLGESDRFVRFAARSVLERLYPKTWTDRLWKETSGRLGREGIVALCRANAADGYAKEIFTWLKQTPPGKAAQDQLDWLRTLQLALIHTNFRPDSVHELAKECCQMFPTEDNRLNRELAVLLTHFQRTKLLQEPVQARLLQALAKAEGNREQQIHYFYCLRLLRDGWTPEQKQQLLAWFDTTKSWTGGHSFSGFLQNIFKDLESIYSAEDRRQALTHADQQPWAALALLQRLSPNERPTTRELTAAYARLVKAGNQPRVRELKEKLIQLLGLDDSAEGLAALRQIADSDPEQLDFVSRSLSRFPTAENWPYLVRGLEAKSPLVLADVIQSLKKSDRKPTLSNPPTSAEAKPYRHLILASGRLPEKQRWSAVELLRQWGNKSFTPEDGDWKTELTGWGRWFSQTFPGEPPLPNVSLLTAQSKWQLKELLSYLEQDARGKDGNVANGRRLFEKANCIKCHKFGTVGEGIGPDLTTLKGRFKKQDILEALLDPSKVISDQYRGSTLITKKGQVITGLAAVQGDTITVLQSDGSKLTLPRSEVDQQLTSTMSPMPERLLDELSREDIADLMAFLESTPPK